MPNKTDRNDARAIAQITRTSWFRAVHVKTSTCRSAQARASDLRSYLHSKLYRKIGISAVMAALVVTKPLRNRKDFPSVLRTTRLCEETGWRLPTNWFDGLKAFAAKANTLPALVINVPTLLRQLSLVQLMI